MAQSLCLEVFLLLLDEPDMLTVGRNLKGASVEKSCNGNVWGFLLFFFGFGFFLFVSPRPPLAQADTGDYQTKQLKNGSVVHHSDIGLFSLNMSFSVLPGYGKK